MDKYSRGCRMKDRDEERGTRKGKRVIVRSGGRMDVKGGRVGERTERKEHGDTGRWCRRIIKEGDGGGEMVVVVVVVVVVGLLLLLLLLLLLVCC